MTLEEKKKVKRKQQRQQHSLLPQRHQICQTNASIVNQVLHECNLQSVKTTLTKDQIRHLIIFLSSSIFYVVRCYCCCCSKCFRTKNIVRMVRMPRASRMSNAFPAVRSAVCSSYSPKVPFITMSSRYSDTVRGYGAPSTTTITTTTS